MKHKFFSLAKSVIIASALIIPLLSSAVDYRFTLEQNSAKSVNSSSYTYRGVGLCGDYLVGLGQCENGTAATAVMIKISTGAVTTGTGGTYGGTDFAIASDDNGKLGYAKWYPYNGSLYLPWRWIYKWDCSSGSVNSGGDLITMANSGGYVTTITTQDYRAQSMRINGNINGTSSIWYLPKDHDYIWEVVTSGGAFSKINQYTVSGISSYTNGALATAYRYDTNKLMVCTPSGLYNCSISGTTASATNITPSGVNLVNLQGSIMFKLRGHTFLARSTSGTAGASSFGVFDVTNGFPGTQIGSTFTPVSGTGATSGVTMWINIRKENDNQMTIVALTRHLCVAKYTLYAYEVLANPTFSPASGTTFNYGSNNVTITGPSGSTIYYKQNGTQKSGASPVTVAVSSNTSLTEVYAQKNGYWDSGNVSASYNVRSADVTYSPSSDTSFSGSTNITLTSASGGTIYYTTNGTTPTTSSSSVTSGGTVTISSTCQIKAFAVSTNYVAGNVTTSPTYTVKCATPTFSTSGGGTSPTTVTISSATSGATIYYTTDGSTPTTSSSSLANGGSFTCSEIGTKTIKAIAVKSNYSDSDVGSTTVTYKPQLASPTFSVATGTQFTTSGRVTITAPAGSTLYYNTDGSEDYNYTTGINTATVDVSVATTLSAYAKQTNHTNSPIVTASYTVKCATPVITPATGTYPKAQEVSIACSTPGATIHYTTDGTTPTASSPIFSPPLTVNDGSNTNEYIPLYCYYSDNYEKHEYIIPAATMSSMGASASSAVSISSLMWHLSSPSSSGMGYTQYQVFLKEVSGTTLGGAFSGPSGGTVVYEGTLNAIQNTLTVNFSTPYDYHGGNLLVGVYTTTKGSYEHVNFYGTTGAEGCSGYKYDSTGLNAITTPETTAGTTNFLPKTTFYYASDPFVVSTTTTVKAIAIKNGCANSDVASETITITPQSQPVAPSSINVEYSPVIGTSTNNPDRDLARIDATITFDRPNTSDGTTFPAYPTTFSDYYLDHYVVTVCSGSSYAKTEGGANFLSVSIDAKSGAGAANTVSLNARDLKLGQQTEVYVTAHYVYQPTSAASQSSQTTKSFSGYTYETYSPSISAKLFLFQNQEYKVWWESEHISVTRYADVYRVEIQINDAMSTSAIPVSYYQLQMRRSPSAEWENIVDRTINNLCYGDSIEAHTTYPTGFGLAAGRFPGNYNFISHQYTADIGTEEEWDINLEYYYAFDVTPPAQSAPHQPLGHIRNYEGNEDPTKWQFRIVAVYGGSDSVTVDGTPVTPTTDNISESTEDVFIQHNDPIITGVDSVKGDANIKEVQYYDLRGVRLNEAPSTGFYIEVRLYDNGQVVTSKRLAR